MANVLGFYGADNKYGAFSNFYEAHFTFKGEQFKWSEQAIMWQKANLFDDYQMANAILEARTPLDAKRMGRRVAPYIESRWVENRENLVVPVLYAKFEQNPDIKELLLSTGDDILAECSPRDKIWGIGMSITHPLVSRPECWPGSNLQGEYLMKVRERLRG